MFDRYSERSYNVRPSPRESSSGGTFAESLAELVTRIKHEDPMHPQFVVNSEGGVLEFKSLKDAEIIHANPRINREGKEELILDIAPVLANI